MKESMLPIQILIVDDHLVVRENPITILNTQHDVRVVGMAADGIEALCKFKALQLYSTA